MLTTLAGIGQIDKPTEDYMTETTDFTESPADRWARYLNRYDVLHPAQRNALHAYERAWNAHHKTGAPALEILED